MKLKLYHYWRSSSSWRVRLALAHKQMACEMAHINLLKNEQNSPGHLLRNPLGLVPCLEVTDATGNTHFINESVAIMEWLDETNPSTPLLPKSNLDRAHVRELVQIVVSDIQPIQNLRVLNKFSDDQEKKSAWARHWVDLGFRAYEKVAKPKAGVYSFGNEISMADLVLIPQVYNAKRYNMDLGVYPLVEKIYINLSKTKVFESSAPERFQPV